MFAVQSWLSVFIHVLLGLLTRSMPIRGIVVLLVSNLLVVQPKRDGPVA